MEKCTAKDSKGHSLAVRHLFYHDGSDCYIEHHHIHGFTNESDEKFRASFEQCDDVTDTPHHELRFRDQKIEDLELKIQTLIMPDLTQEGRALIFEDLKNRLPDTFRQIFPMYQFFRECGPLEAFAVIQSQMQIANCNLGVTAVFLFQDEANMAAKWMKDRDTKGMTFHVVPTRVSHFKGF